MTTFPIPARACISLKRGRFGELTLNADGTWSVKGRILTSGDSALLVDEDTVRLCTVRRNARGWHFASGDGDAPRLIIRFEQGARVMVIRSGVEVQEDSA